MSELTPEGKKVWDKPWNKATVVVDRKTNIERHLDNSVPFGWVVAKDCMSALKTGVHDCTPDELAHDAVYNAIALCNALGEGGE